MSRTSPGEPGTTSGPLIMVNEQLNRFREIEKRTKLRNSGPIRRLTSGRRHAGGRAPRSRLLQSSLSGLSVLSLGRDYQTARPIPLLRLLDSFPKQ